MEMESSRRSFNSSNQPGLKKPKLNEEHPLVRNNKSNGRAGAVALTAALGGVGGAGSTRYRAGNDRDLEGSGGCGYQPQPAQHQELISQYRTALAELTFNSKPIITNLTIIAGENVNAAKAIAATICNNIIEVPSDQKLPSLYLLDSIVKNIGRDYIKYFAVRLPEVFCKAYKHVDPATHPGMRHLFGTWKGVFPLQSLQLIEKELGFVSTANGSSSGTTTSKPDSLSQRPAHSIHVNPKYLVVRQQLQSKAKESGNDANLGTEDGERLERTTTISSGRSRADPRLKMLNMQQSQRDVASEPVRENNIGETFGDFEYNSDVSRQSDVNFGKASKKVTEQGFDKSRYGAGNNSTETVSSQRNGFDTKLGLSNNPAAKYANADAKIQPMHNIASRNSSGLTKSWKNSEEEEYMWDDIHPRLTNHGSASSSRRDPRLPAESERLVGVKKDFGNHIQKAQDTNDIVSRVDRETSSDSLSTEQKDQATFVHHVSSPWSLEPRTNAGTSYSGSTKDMSTSANSMGRTSFQSQPGSSHLGDQNFGAPSNTLQGQHQRNFGDTPSGQSIIPQLPPSPSFSFNHNHLLPNVTEQEHPSSQLLPNNESKAARSQGQFNGSTHSRAPQDSLQALPQNAHSSNSQRLQLNNLQTPPSIRPPFDPRQHNSFLQPLQSENAQSEPSLLPQIPVIRKPLTSLKSSPDDLKPHASEISRHSSTSSLLAAVMSSGILGSKSVNGSLPELNFKSEAGAQPPLPSGSSPTLFASSGAKDSSSSLYNPYFHEISSLSSLPLRKTDKPPLPPGLPPSLIGSASASASSASNPVSSLLSTLVAKGLISASKGESLTQTSSQSPSKSLKGVTAAITVSSASISSALPPLSTNDAVELSVPATESFTALPPLSSIDVVQLSVPAAKSSSAFPLPTKTEIKSVIGFEFKPDVIRKTHSAVISELIDDLPHQCSICGLRFKLQERYDRHIEWHALRSSEPNSSNKLSRRWYANSVDWVTGKAVQQSSSESMDLDEGSETELEISTEQMVPADESQCVCILCGEMFKDFYSQERDEWMFEGAVYLSNSSDRKAGNNSDNATNGPIVHGDCISESSLPDLGLVNDVQVKKGT